MLHLFVLPLCCTSVFCLRAVPLYPLPSHCVSESCVHRLGPLNTAREGDTRPHSPGTIGVAADEGGQFSRTSLPHPTQLPSPVQPPTPCRVPGPGYVRRAASLRVYRLGCGA
ncbi:hypothetical protein E2C01_090534 [Portunus trituberculatus]|uniref:Secreted protein n=1 Tax=Portunus trituberculatus TaxID=210409 RepID=A0A5B7JQD0_PORTR|nr:hypothetical protein [Portunus trituberculatus]